MGKVVVTGRPGSGKTTLVLRVAEELRRTGEQLSGFTTSEIRRGGRRTGFTVTGIASGLERRLAVEGGPGPRVGRYGVDVSAFEEVAILELESGLELGATLIVDEIGRMELLSAPFADLLPKVFEAPRLLTAVQVHPDPVTDELKRRPDVAVFDLSTMDRDFLVGPVTESILS